MKLTAAATNLGITTGVHIPITPGPIAHLVDHNGVHKRYRRS